MLCEILIIRYEIPSFFSSQIYDICTSSTYVAARCAG